MKNNLTHKTLSKAPVRDPVSSRLSDLLDQLGVSFRVIEQKETEQTTSSVIIIINEPNGGYAGDDPKRDGKVESDFNLNNSFLKQLSNGKQITGQKFTRFRILEKIGEGGMSLVYKAVDLNLNRQVALKILPVYLCRKGMERDLFLQEARIISSLDHPYICAVYEIFETADGSLFMVMPCYDGKTLRHRMMEMQLKQEQALMISKQIASGLAKAHTCGIVHQDIKPENIIITDEGIVKIIDFGVAKLIGNNLIAMDTTTRGTIAYMAPEQIGGFSVDHRADIWSLGMVLNEMLSGERLFEEEYEQAVIYSILHETPELDPGIPGRLKNIIFKCLAKSPDNRYQNISEFLYDIEVFHQRARRLRAV